MPISSIRPFVLAIDPGVISGIALISREGPKVIWSGEADQQRTGEIVDSLLYKYGGENVSVTCEKYYITSQTAKKSPQPASLEVTGMVRWLAHLRGSGSISQYSPDAAKSMFPNDTLHRLECWHKGGAGHARDAIRHGLLHLVHTTWSDRRMLAPQG